MGKMYVIFAELLHETTLKGNNCCKMYNFRIKVGNLQMLYSATVKIKALHQ
jgi:hypothetical protein